MNKYTSFLSKLWLSEAEQEIYLSLLSRPYRIIADIVRDARYHRPMVYRSLRRLEAEWLVEKSYLDGKRYHYHATSPEKLRDKLNDILSIADTLIPELKELHKKNHTSPILSIAEGIAGIRDIHDDVLYSLSKGWEYLCYASSKEWREKSGVYVSEDYNQTQKQKEISRKIITNSQEKETNDPYREIASIPWSFDRFDDDITKIIYGNKVAVIDYNSQMGWIIDDARFARYEEKIFRLLHKLLKKEEKNAFDG